ncbi:phage major capsid protein [Mycobacterium avium]|uniref:phage major capsid protein n=1 Tax=Mycobacterium avium TaxID=1764 RepID=UPI000CE4449A|nr:phage major capsid protein [Mycobacterium avium]
MTDIAIDQMSLDQCRSAAQELLDSTTGDLVGADAERFEALRGRAEQIRDQERQRATATRDLVQRLAAGELSTESGAPQDRGDRDQDRPPAEQRRDDAMRTLDRAVKADRLAARGAELVESLMRSGPAPAQTWTQRYAIAAGSEHYERAFAKLLADPVRGHMTWTQQEADAYRAVDAVLTEQRAMSTSDVSGGYMIPLTLDPAIMLTSAGSVNPLRQISRVVQTVTESWNGVTSAGVTAEWTDEAEEVADASPSLGQPSIPVHKGDAFVPFSFEVQDDAVNFMSELGKLLQDAADQLTATAYTVGSGSGQPTGVITKLVASAGTVPLVSPATGETLSPGDVFTVQNALAPRFQPRAVWNANLAIINTLRQFETNNGALKFPELQANPPMLLGRQMYENSNMDGTINPAATENNYPLVYGSFADGFVIVDRLGSTLELVPHLFGANRRPTGQRGALLWFRTGSDVVIPNAFRLLSIPTSA